jgi:glycosyltransferase involved in cell wall biosynthesis
MRKLIIIPTYNERENIEAMVAKVLSLPGDYSLLVVDDASPDGTADIVWRIQTTHPERLFMIERSGKLGLGTAYLAGFEWALWEGYDVIYEMDCDFSHDPDDLLRLTAAIEEGALDEGFHTGEHGHCVGRGHGGALGDVLSELVELIVAGLHRYGVAVDSAFLTLGVLYFGDFVGDCHDSRFLICDL